MDETIAGTGELGKDDILDELMKDDSIEPDKETADLLKPLDHEDKEGDEDGTEEKDEEKEEKVEIKDEDEESYTDVPKRQVILKEFPELFKKFPGLEKSIYREQQYAELFPTISDAREAADRLADFKSFEGELFDGSIEGILKSVKSSNEKAFGKITGGILQTLHKVDEKSYYSTLNHVIKSALSTAFKSAKSSGDDQLEIASQLLHKFIYGSTTVSEPEIVANEPDEKESKLTEREQNFAKQQLGNAINDVSTRTDNLIKSTVDKYIDTKSVMTSYVRGKAVDDVMTRVRSNIDGDARFKAVLDKLWQASARDGYSEVSKTKIRNALISKARTILPGIIQKVKVDALKGLATRTREASEPKDEKPLPSGRASASNTSSGSKKGEVPKGMKTLDFLMQD